MHELGFIQSQPLISFSELTAVSLLDLAVRNEKPLSIIETNAQNFGDKSLTDERLRAGIRGAEWQSSPIGDISARRATIRIATTQITRGKQESLFGQMGDSPFAFQKRTEIGQTSGFQELQTRTLFGRIETPQILLTHGSHLSIRSRGQTLSITEELVSSGLSLLQLADEARARGISLVPLGQTSLARARRQASASINETQMEAKAGFFGTARFPTPRGQQVTLRGGSRFNGSYVIEKYNDEQRVVYAHEIKSTLLNQIIENFRDKA